MKAINFVVGDANGGDPMHIQTDLEIYGLFILFIILKLKLNISGGSVT